MKVDSDKLIALYDAVAGKFGRIPRTPSDFMALSDDVLLHTGRTIGITTLKRLWRYVNDNSGTTFTTLSLLSQYCGYNDWDAFINQSYRKMSKDYESGFAPDNLIVSALIPVGTRICLKWSNKKMCIVRKIDSSSTYFIESSENIKLQTGDTAIIEYLARGKTFYALQCMRGPIALGTYSGARRSGLESIEFLKPEHDIEL